MSACILVVDDHPNNRLLCVDLLEAAGYRMLEAGDAESARAILARERPDLILMDLALPGMDGLALTQLLKSDPTTRHILVAAVTSFAMKGDEARARAAGCDAYFTKPIDTRSFPTAIAALLQQRR